MELNHYYLTTTRSRNFVDAGKNKKAAILAGRIMACDEKCSIELWACRKVEGVGTLGRYYIGMLEFPYYLRDLQLIPHDITVNLM